MNFRQFLINEMVARSPERATQLLNYVHKKQIKKGLVSRWDFQSQMVNLLPKHPTGVKSATVPFAAFDPSHPYHKEAAAHFGEPQLRDVPVHTLVSNQSHVSKKVVGRKIAGTWPQHYPDYPYVVHHEGKHYVLDGNHRGNEARLRGEKTMKAYVIDTKPNP